MQVNTRRLAVQLSADVGFLVKRALLKRWGQWREMLCRHRAQQAWGGGFGGTAWTPVDGHGLQGVHEAQAFDEVGTPCGTRGARVYAFPVSRRPFLLTLCADERD